MRVVSYTRTVSCKPKADLLADIPADIIGQQNKRIEEYIQQYGWKLSKKYSDRKKAVDANDDFEQMMRDGMKREFDVVVVDSIYRCGRKLWFAEEVLFQTFYPAGIHFVVVEDQFNSMEKEENEIKAYFHNKRNEYKGAELRRNRDSRKSDGRFSCYHVNYGMTLSMDCKSLLVEEEGAKVIREIYRLFLEKYTYSDIVKECEKRGFTTPKKHMCEVLGQTLSTIRPAKWAASTIKRILTNPIYIGELPESYYVSDGYIEPLIEKSVFDEVQKQIAERFQSKRFKNEYTPTNILAKRIYSKTTGGSMYCVGPADDLKNRAFVEEKCTMRRIKEGRIKSLKYELVLEQVRETLIHERRIAESVMMKIQSSEGEHMYLESVRTYQEKARELFDQIEPCSRKQIAYAKRFANGEINRADYENGKQETTSAIEGIEPEFKSLMAQVENLQVAFGKTNPWLVLFLEMKVPEKVERDHIVKYIDRVWIENMETIRVIVKENAWKALLPAEWVEY